MRPPSMCECTCAQTPYTAREWNRTTDLMIFSHSLYHWATRTARKVGFEPTMRKTQSSLAKNRLKPLGHFPIMANETTGVDRTWTCNLLHAKQPLSQLSYNPTIVDCELIYYNSITSAVNRKVKKKSHNIYKVSISSRKLKT